MIILLSPSKGMNTRDLKPNNWLATSPSMLNISEKIANHFKKWDINNFKQEMALSEKLAQETFQAYKDWKIQPDYKSPTLQSIFAYQGDVYGGLNARNFDINDLNFANDHLRIISGLYGLLKPSDLIMEYRLEIGFSKEIESLGKLYAIWKPIITQQINEELKASKENLIFDLTSKEYGKAVDFKLLSKYKRIEFEFYEIKEGKLAFASFNSKRARGLMANFIIKNRISKLEDLKLFDLENYKYSQIHSTELKYVFIR